ncbi:unnamed protein product [Paramecium pentaurelia]|uniref:Uncharacterized protein n=1 Tax=Paramecium pentaurelia TaxID=43138 RepID=A0A8S1V100_9CILI|nr:unnamed protein product [Paramecium pentaurelia]
MQQNTKLRNLIALLQYFVNRICKDFTIWLLLLFIYIYQFDNYDINTEQSLILLKYFYQIYIAKNFLPLESTFAIQLKKLFFLKFPIKLLLQWIQINILLQSNYFPLCSNQVFEYLFAIIDI